MNNTFKSLMNLLAGKFSIETAIIGKPGTE
jgi:hypothetical protein